MTRVQCWASTKSIACVTANSLISSATTLTVARNWNLKACQRLGCDKMEAITNYMKVEIIKSNSSTF